MSGTQGLPGKPGEAGRLGAGGAGGRGGAGGDPSGTGGPGGAGGMGGTGGTGGDLGSGGPDYAGGRRRFRTLVMGSLVLASVSVFMSAFLFARVMGEGKTRRDQTCNLFERQHLTDVTRLGRTYAYLELLPRDEYGTNLTRAIVRQLPDLEEEARTDLAPLFCDAEGVGLAEPDPRLPRKRDFSYLLKRP